MSLRRAREQMFDGRFDHSLDDKGRFLVPIQYRKLISDGEWFVIRSRNNRAIEVYPKKQGLALKKKIEDISAAEASGRNAKFIEWIQRLSKESKEITIDNQNRILIPKYMRDWAKIDDVAVIIGTDRGCFEVWNSDVFDETMDMEFYQYEGRDEILNSFDLTVEVPQVSQETNLEAEEGSEGE
jgi:MraZ protein